jgi:hypothetical protein
MLVHPSHPAILAAGITVSAKVIAFPEFRSFENFTIVVIVWLVLSAACDIVIAVGMTHALVCVLFCSVLDLFIALTTTSLA